MKSKMNVKIGFKVKKRKSKSVSIQKDLKQENPTTLHTIALALVLQRSPNRLACGTHETTSPQVRMHTRTDQEHARNAQ